MKRRFRIAGHEYRVILTKGIIDPDKRGAIGQCKNNTHELKIDTTQEPSEQSVVFLHEILHAISFRYFFNTLFGEAGTTENEEMIDRLSEALYQVLSSAGIDLTVT